MARVNLVIGVRFLVDPTQIFLPMNMVGTSVLGKLRMRKQNAKTTVPLDVVPERRTKRCSPQLPSQIFLPMNMVGTSILGKLRMRKQNTKTTVPLDAVPERRTKRCSPRFRPGGRFCELRFRYQSSPTGSEGEISRPLDHM